MVTLAFLCDMKLCENLYMDFRNKNRKAEKTSSYQTCMHLFPEGQDKEYIYCLYIL